MTLTEKLLARAAGKDVVHPGQTVLANVDVLMTHDVCGPGTIGVFHREFGNDARVWDPDRVVIIPDHYVFTADDKAARNIDTLREFANTQGIRYFYDVIDDPAGSWHFDAQAGHHARQFGCRYGGVCHSALAEKGHTCPGEVLLGTDSHTCTAGAFGQFGTGIGNTDAAFVLGTGKLLLRVPESMRFVLTGALPDGVMAKDVIVHIIGQVGVDGATYRAMEFAGDGIASLLIEDRMTIANMAIEAGAKNAVFSVDDQTRQFVDARMAVNGTTRDYVCLEADADAAYVTRHEIDLSTLEPVIAKHPDPANVALARESTDIKLHRAYIGSCTGGKISDFDAFAAIVRGRTVAVDTFGVPATPAVLEHLYTATLDGKSLWDILIDAGVTMTENPGCAACLGGPVDTFGRMNEPMTCISTTNRNFPGRMGHLEGAVILASPATVAASALAGCVADPREALQSQARTLS
ncbi:MAG: 3-isopropylmalate dehydratase large subunit [Planctomycetota bacterium]|jgi:3-isopropylmalate/(R)-2-methylmalate dehydratase large subunit